MLETWFDPAAIAIVLVGTLIATLLRCGVADSRIALGALRGLFERAFDVARAKSELALQIREIADDGFIRAEPHHFGDSEFDSLSDLIISQRSIQSLHGEHQKFKEARLANAQTAVRVFDCAAELAPVLGLAGTLIALGQAQGAAAQDAGLVGAIAMAVVTTLYGLLAANFLFAPLGAAVARKSRQEERDRDAVLEWLARGIRQTGVAGGTPHSEREAA
ncbi:MAG: MotA/TolQ/ExbB proton channel family protein [Erythrobacter sp.]|jgi:chemotaxis protein MotA|uniref:MotA/TolQ/ExbB proton channel family protein n=1 Tax=Qipengyuania citrea TaxID=225971 RepID=UPI00209DAB72|nr:MotA/TolQ/ExbB proton channel family protein [Qipengyuania citrea]MCP2018860.1 chemotaxis protein MotA [Qipengyuania citrea]MDE0902201.1 MotA/TolQ/ExbB proton channel family protein [Erythrobacter sp.]